MGEVRQDKEETVPMRKWTRSEVIGSDGMQREIKYIEGSVQTAFTSLPFVVLVYHAMTG